MTTILLLGATIAAAYTGDWSLPGFAARGVLLFFAIMLFFIVHTFLILVFVFWPILIAIIMVWTGFRVLFKQRSKKGKNEAPPGGEQPGTN